jgi:hypothetical protein
LPNTVVYWGLADALLLPFDFFADRLAQRLHVVSVDHADVGEVELFEEQARRPVCLQRLLEDRADALDPLADPSRQPRERLLGVLPRVVQLGIEAHAGEVARERTDVRGDRHAVVVDHDHDRLVQATGVQQRLEGHAAGERAIADHRHDLAVLADARAHGLLDADRVRDRGRGVPGAHDVVLGLPDRAERREAAVGADCRELVATTGENLVRICLMTDVPEHLVGRRVEQRVQRHGDLADAEVGAEVAADLPDRVDDQLADLLRDLLQLVLVEVAEIRGPIDLVEQLGHTVRVRM